MEVLEELGKVRGLVNVEMNFTRSMIFAVQNIFQDILEEMGATLFFSKTAGASKITIYGDFT